MEVFPLLFRGICSRSHGNEIVSIGSYVNLGIQSANVLPQTSEHLTGTKTLHQSVQFSDNRDSVVLWVVRLILVDSKKTKEPPASLRFLTLSSAMKMVIARWDGLSLLFLKTATGKSKILGDPLTGQTRNSTSSLRICRHNLFNSLQ